MGTLGQMLQGILQPQQTQQPDPLASYRPPLAGPGPMTEAVMGFPSVARGGPMTSPPIVGPGEGPPALAMPEDVRVDGWKPKKPTVLGAIADAFLMSKGGRPMYSMMRNQEDMQKAMRGFVDDPKEAIRRIAQIPGMQEKAWEMMNQLSDNERADLIAGANADAKKEKYLTRVGGMLNQIKNSKDPVTAYKQNIGIIRKYGEGRGLTEEMAALGDEYSPDTIDNFIMGGVSPEDQIRMEALADHRRNRLELDKGKRSDMREYREERLEDFDENRESQDRRAATAEQGRNNRSKSAPGKSEPRFVKTPKGWMELSPSGKTGKIGEQVWKRVAKDQWERVK
jgi:hypothetical protein